MPKKTIAQTEVSGKRVLIRVDFNVPIDSGRITDDRRIRAAVPTIKSVLDRGGSAVLMSHLGRPEGVGYEASESLKPCADRLAEILGVAVEFPSNDPIDEKAAAAVKALRPGGVLLLDNLRFHKGEKKGDAAFAAKLAAYGDIYCNDAFGTCHREDASMYAVPSAMAGKPRVVGLLVDRELKYLSEALRTPAKPYVVVMGGAKVSDKLPMIEQVLQKADAVLIGGAMAYTFLKALGKQVGASRVEESMLPDAKRILDEAARLKCDLLLPQDHVCSTQFAEKAGEIETFTDAIKPGYMGLDIGPKTQTAFALRIRKARTIVWNGPMGVFEWAPFRIGTQQVASAMVHATRENGAISIVGGGDSAAAAELFGMADQFSHVSTGGGASLEMLAGKSFKTVELLDNA
ncbi:MAG: phosphoglycerate kinase [Phycisphaeraceae bacterium]|nr:phosphoglycerate kinase [Phycisphaeraceae bacterium]